MRRLNKNQVARGNGYPNAGATVHNVTGEIDGVPPVLQARVAVADDASAEPLAAKVLAVEDHIYPEAVNWHLTGRLSFEDGVLHKDRQPVPPTGYLWDGNK